MAKTTKPKKTSFKKLIRWFWILVFAGLGSFALLIFAAAMGWLGKLPSIEELENPKSNLASQIISSDDMVLGKFFAQNRTHVEYEELSPYLINALVATEDERYYSHSGVDVEALVRAVAKMGSAGGGSTISQQLAKMLFHDPAQSKFARLSQKVKEWVISVQLERKYTKEEIIAMYFNRFDFLNLAVGVQSASTIYFSKKPADLEIHEAAMLVGMAKNPSLYNPLRNAEGTRGRRNIVFLQMERNEVITRAERDSLRELPLGLEYNPASHNTGTATYFREELRSFMKDWVSKNKKADGTEYNIYTDGLKIYTTVDFKMQKYAEEAMEEHMANLQRVFFLKEEGRKTAPFHGINQDRIDRLLTAAKKRSGMYRSLKRAGMSKDSIDIVFNTPKEMTVFSWKGDIDTTMSPMDSIRYYKYFLQTGFMAMEPQTGYIKAWVGGINYRHFQYDHVKTGQRQVGSTFKPFVYATAMRQLHLSPCYEVADVQTCIEKGQFDLLKDWCPKNSDGKYGGVLTLKEALGRSKNTVTTYLMKQVGPEPVSQLAKEMGVKSDIPIQPAIALGTPDLTVYEMVGAYGTFANKGVYTEPIMVTRIEDKNGVVLAEFTPDSKDVMSEEQAYVLLDLLQGVTTSGGSGARLRSRGGSYLNDVVTGFPYAFDYSTQIAGKTGTTQDNSDGWFMGVVPNLVAGAWVGGEDRDIHFSGIYYGQGATMALPIWALFMKKVYADGKLGVTPTDKFEKPVEKLSIELDCEKYKQQNTGNPFNESSPEGMFND